MSGICVLISEEYRAQNAKLHECEHYGVSANIWFGRVLDLCRALQTHDVLDYGCGKRRLEANLGWEIANYDPAIPGLDSPPEPHDVVACIDVLEHIEPECLDDVLDDLQRLIKRAGFFLIANRPASKTLPDGRNAHLIQEDLRFWLPKILDRWEVSMCHEVEQGGKVQAYVVVVRRR